jgi:hypothetical protein
MAPPGKPSSNDDETLSAIYKGVNQDQLMRIFRMDHRTIKRKLIDAKAAGIKPVGHLHNADLYQLHEVAPYLCKPVFDPAEYIKQMDPRELPKILTKEFWAGQRSRQEYEERAGQLWRTEKVVEEVGELMKLVKMSSLLMLDAVERKSELSEVQRSIIRTLTHGMLDDLMKRVQDRFKVPEDVQLQKAEADEEL